MQYMLLVYGEETALGDAERQACYGESTRLAGALRREGCFLATRPLQSVRSATTVRLREGKRLLTDGPFAETREQLGGFFLVEARDLDQALAIAARIPAARWGSIEVRPVVELAGLPEDRIHAAAEERQS